MTPGRVLGIDYGSKRIGVAVSDERGILAFPKTIISNGPGALGKILDIVRTEQISEIVVGESLDFKGNPNAIAQEISAFVSELARSGLPIYTEKEFLTSVEARRLLEKKREIDASAAAVILQRYLDRKNVKSGDYHSGESSGNNPS